MAKTRSNKRPTTTNATVVDNKASLGNTTTTIPTTTTPTNALSTVVKTRTRSKKSKEGLTDEKPDNVIPNKKNSKINLSTIENTHNTRRRSLNNKNIKNAADDMDTSNMDSSPETATDSNGTPESLSDNENEVIKVIEIVDESQSYNLHEDYEDEDGKEYELIYVDDAEDNDGEIEYLNEEYLLDDDFIIQEQQNDDNSQISMLVENNDDLTLDSVSHDEVVKTETDSSVSIVSSNIVKLPPIVPMATRSRRSHVSVVDGKPEKLKSAKRNSKLVEKQAEGPIEFHEINKELEMVNVKSSATLSESTKKEEISKPKGFIPNIEPPATRARSRKSISNSDPVVPIKSDIINSSLAESIILKSDVTFKMEPEVYLNNSKIEENSFGSSANINQSLTENINENLIPDTSLCESKLENIPTSKPRGRRRTKFLSTCEINKAVLVGSKEISNQSNLSESALPNVPKDETIKETQEKSDKNIDEISFKMQNSKDDLVPKIVNVIVETLANDKSSVNSQPVPIRTTRNSKIKVFKTEVEPTVEKLETHKNDNTMNESETDNDNKINVDMVSTSIKKPDKQHQEDHVQSKDSTKTENDTILLPEIKLKIECENDQAVEVIRTTKTDFKREEDSSNKSGIAEDAEKQDQPQLVQSYENMEVDIEPIITETNEVDTIASLKKLRRKSKKDNSPSRVSQIETVKSDISKEITTTKTVPEIPENTENINSSSCESENKLNIIKSNIAGTKNLVTNTAEQLNENEEQKNSQEGKQSIKPTASRSHLAYTSIISTRRQKKEQTKYESVKPLENVSDTTDEKLLEETPLANLNTKESNNPTTVNEASLCKLEPHKLELVNHVEEMEISVEKETVKQLEKMEVDQINPLSTELNETKPKDDNGESLEQKLKNISLDQVKNRPMSEENSPNTDVVEPNSTKIKEFETKINRNFYAEAFAGLSHETRTHIFEALLRSKGDTKVVPNKDTLKDEPIEFDDKKNIFVKKKSSKKIKKSSKKERKLDKNEIPVDDSKIEDDESLRRSSRIKTISQTRQRSHGHGLVKARDRFRDMKDEIDEENSNRVTYKALEIDAPETKDFTMSKETEAEMQREREMIQRLKQFTTVKENIYHCDKNISKEAKKMTCDCFLTKEEIERGELGCGEDCLNRLLMIECGPKCVVAERCTNRKFQKTQYANCKVFQTEKKGFGIMAGAVIPPGEFIMEYVGEVLNSEQFEKRADDYSKEKNKHYYFMALRSDAVIDATTKGNISRFINHSCDPNAETQKWTVNGELRIGFFSTRFILKGEEITFDYQFQRYGKEAQKCFCEASNCRGWIGEEPDSADEDDDDEDEDEEEDEEEEEVQPTLPKVKPLESVPSILAAPITELKEINKESINTPAVESITVAQKEIAQVISLELQPAVSQLSEIPTLVPIVPKEKLKKRTKKERKALVKTRKTRSELLEDADLEEEISILNRTGLKNQAHTLKLSRLMVRAKLMNARIRLLQLLQNGEMPCRRLFLDYHGLRLLHGWMSDSTAVSQNLDNLKFQLKLLDTLKALPIPNKTMLKDSKVINLVQKWSVDDKKHYSPNDDTPSDSGSGTPIQVDSPNQIASQSSSVAPQPNVSSTVDDELVYVSKNILKISLKLIENWECLPEVFRIPKKERIEQMKEHEREADLRYKALGLSEETTETYDRYQEKKQERIKNRDKKLPYNNHGNNINCINNSSNKTSNSNTPQLDKYQRRQIFEMKFAKEQEEKKKQEYWRLHEMTCTCFRLDPRKTVPEDVPAIVNPATGQWYTKEMKPAATPPSHIHIKPPEQVLSTNPDDYILPEIDLPPHWKFAIDTKGRIYYYHVKIRIPQWEPPIFLPPLAVADDVKLNVTTKEKDAVHDADKDSSSTDTTDSSEDELKDRINNLKQRFKERGQPLPEINITDSELVESLDADAKNKDNFSDTFPRIDPVKSSYKINKRKRRREGLVQERIISPRTEEDKIYGQQQSRLYRETKEKLRRRKEEMRKRRLLESGSLSMRNNKIIKLTDGLPVSISPYDSDESDDETEQSYKRNNDSINQNDPDSAVDFVESLISHNMSDNDARLLDGLKEIGKEKVNKKNVYEEWKKQQAKLKSDARKRELNHSKLLQSTSASSSSSSGSSHIKRRKVAMDNIDLSTVEIRRIKEKFRTDIAGVIVQHLGPYRKESCKIGRILHDEDFKHLARKLTHFVMLKELKHCDNTVNILEVTDSVKIKSREFIKKYMAKYGAVYRRGENEPDYKD